MIQRESAVGRPLRLDFLHLAWLACCLALPAGATPPADQGIVLVACVQGGQLVSTGTGFTVNAEGVVVTNEHVIHPPGQGRCAEVGIAWLEGGTPRQADTRVLAADGRLDLALLKAEQAPPHLPLFSGAIERDFDVRVIGFPGAANTVGARIEDHLEPTLTRGVVSRVVHDDKGRQIVQTDAAISSGNSGGPVLDRCGRVLGVATFIPSAEVKAQTGAEGIGWAVHVSEVISFLRQHAVAFADDDAPCGGPVAAAAAPATEVPTQRTFGGPLWGILFGIIGLALTTVVFLILRHHLPAISTPRKPVVTHTLHVAGQAHPLGALTTVGRDPDICEVLLPPDTEGVSRRHLEIRLGASGPEVRDCWSTAGTRLGGQVLPPGQWTAWPAGVPLLLGTSTEARWS